MERDGEVGGVRKLNNMHTVWKETARHTLLVHDPRIDYVEHSQRLAQIILNLLAEMERGYEPEIF